MDARFKRYHYEVKGIRTVSVLNYVDYNKNEVKKVIAEELGWRDYGGKHFESIWTRFYQGYILPQNSISISERPTSATLSLEGR